MDVRFTLICVMGVCLWSPIIFIFTHKWSWKEVISMDLKVTGGPRWTVDKHCPDQSFVTMFINKGFSYFWGTPSTSVDKTSIDREIVSPPSAVWSLVVYTGRRFGPVCGPKHLLHTNLASVRVSKCSLDTDENTMSSFQLINPVSMPGVSFL